MEQFVQTQDFASQQRPLQNNPQNNLLMNHFGEVVARNDSTIEHLNIPYRRNSLRLNKYGTVSNRPLQNKFKPS